MFDLTRAVGYRGFDLNSVILTSGAGGAIYGCEIRRVQSPGVQGYGYDEKRALSDGNDASDVYLGKRQLQIEGAVYGRTRGECWDYLQALLTALTPTAAYAEAPDAKGFLPLDFYVPTADLATWPAGYVHRMLLARALRQPSFVLESDTHGGDDARALSITWSVVVECVDPRVYYFDPTITQISTSANSGSGTLRNKGDYPAPLNLLLTIAGGGSGGAFHLVAGGSDLSINLPVIAGTRIIRYSAQDKVLTSEDSTGLRALRMDLLVFNASTSHPLVPVGSSAYSWSKDAGIDLITECRMWHNDAWA